MPFVALSIAPQPLLPEACKFLLVSETAADNCRPLHIPISDICRGPPKATSSVPRVVDHHKLIVGKCCPEFYWAFQRIPNNACAWKHAALWLDRDQESEQRTNPPTMSECAIHPSLPHCILRVQCLGSTPLLITRFSDHSSVMVEPGQPQFLRAYDTVSIGDSTKPNSSEQCAVLRFLPVAQQQHSSVAVLPLDAQADSRDVSINPSLASSLLQFTTAPNARSMFQLSDASVRRGGCVTCTEIMSLILSDVVTNLTIVGITSMPMLVGRSSTSGLEESQCADVEVPQYIPPPTTRAAARPTEHMVVIGDTPPPEKPPSHVSESDPDVVSSCSNTQTEPRALVSNAAIDSALSVRRRLVVSTPQQPSTSKAYSARKRNSDTLPTINSSLVVRASSDPHDSSHAKRIVSSGKRARSDSTTSACSPSQAREVIPCPSRLLQRHHRQELPQDEDQFVMVPASIQSLGRTNGRSSSSRDEDASSLSSSSSAYTAASLPDSFDDKWDEHLLALEAKSTVRAVPNAPSPVKLFGGPSRQGAGSNSTLVPPATTIGRHHSNDHMVAPPHSLRQSRPTRYHEQDDVPPESQMVFFGHSQ
jgi:hypothetical protein